MNPPQDYSQWKELFGEIQHNTRVSSSDIDLVSKGTLSASGQGYSQYVDLVVDTVNCLITRRSNYFLKELNLYLQMGEITDIALLFRRYVNDIKHAYFFENITVLSNEDISQIKYQVDREILDLWDGCMIGLKKQIHCSTAFEDVFYAIKRLNPTGREANGKL